jgi:hypothetical protein
MDLLGTFGFGRLIRTFLPGSVILFAVALAIDGALYLIVGVPYGVVRWMQEHEVLGTACAIPLALIFGVLSNTLSFMYLRPHIIKKPYKRDSADFVRNEEKIFDYLINTHVSRVLPRKLANLVENQISMLFLALPYASAENTAFLLDSYWYFHEAQLNLAFATITLCAAILFYLGAYGVFAGLGLGRSIVVVSLLLIFTIFIVLAFVRAAQTNYREHTRKRLSLILGAFASSSEESNIRPYSHLDESIDHENGTPARWKPNHLR